MALLPYALTTVDKLLSYMGTVAVSEELFTVYHDGTGGATQAEIDITSSKITLVTNIEANLVTVATFPTIQAVVDEINTFSGWVAAVLAGRGAALTADLDPLGSTSVFLLAGQKHITGLNLATFQDAINAATEEIETLTSRRFALTTYNQLFNGSGRRRINLRHFPVTNIDRVAVGRRDAFRIKNDSTDAADANVSIDGSNMVLEIVGGANAGTDSVAYTTTTTLAAFITSINAIGKAWVATIETDADGTWLVDELFQFEGRNALRNELSIAMADQSLRSYDIDAPIGQIVRTNVGRSTELLGPQFLRTGGHAFTPWELRPLTAESAGPFWPEGVFNVYVRYTAGFATIPADIEMIANRVAAAIVRMRKRDPTLQSESMSGYSYTRAADDAPLTDSIKKQLQKYKRIWAGPVADV